MSDGTDRASFKKAPAAQNVPGIADSFSAAQVIDLKVTIKVATGTVCSGQVEGAINICVAKLQNMTPAGPFGGCIAFPQDVATRKRAIE